MFESRTTLNGHAYKAWLTWKRTPPVLGSKKAGTKGKPGTMRAAIAVQKTENGKIIWQKIIDVPEKITNELIEAGSIEVRRSRSRHEILIFFSCQEPENPLNLRLIEFVIDI